MAMVQSEASIIVALHIGSFTSGFAYAHKSRPKDITNHPFPWMSAIYYEPGDAATAKVKSFGCKAKDDHEEAVKLKRRDEMSEVGTYFSSFIDAGDSSTVLLQKSFTLTQVISDFLRLMCSDIMGQLQRYGSLVSMNDVEWCVVLAHDWGDHAMKLMKTSMERAGFVQSAIYRGWSPHPLRFVPEMDAASYRCLRDSLGSHIKAGDKLLVANLGYDSCDITVQEVHSVERSKFEVKQVAESVKLLDGPKQFDEILMENFLAYMLPVQDSALAVHDFKQFFGLYSIPWRIRQSIMQCYDYGPNDEMYRFELPFHAQNRWKQLDFQHGYPIRESYDVIEVSHMGLHRAVQPYLDECEACIKLELLSTPEMKAILFDGELCSLYNFMKLRVVRFFAKVVKDLKPPVKMVAGGIFSASEGAVAMVLDQVLPSIWEGVDKQSKDGAAASSSHGDGDGITTRTSSPEKTEVRPGRGTTSPSFESTNALGGGEGSEPSVEKKPSNSRVEGVVKKYSWDEVLLMTNGLTSKMLGKGGFGTVYLGKFENGKEVAVKVLNQSSQEDKLETFVNEVNLMIQVNHVNLVKLLGYCQDKRNVVIYEYAEEGSVGDHLHGDKTRLNDWKQRLSIMVQAAYGLDYLHSQCSPTIIHRDIKSENILLTKNRVAKVADFGISKLMGVDEKTHLTTKLIGSPWYIDPEYQGTGQLRQSSDVYSFGIVLLEMISGQRPAGIGAWVNKIYGSGGGGAIKAIADSSFKGNYNPKAMKLVIKLAMSCIDRIGTSRPMMRQVVDELKKAQSIEEEKKKSWFKFLR